MKNITLTVLLLISTFSFAQKTSSEWPEMVAVDGGTFQLGAILKDTQAEKDEKPQVTVTVQSFLMSKFEVTVWEWKEYVAATKATMPPKQDWGWHNDFPITNITWEEAIEYCNWLSEKQGLKKAYSKSGPRYVCNFNANGFRLPTEAEWEFAARGGVKAKGYKFSGSNETKFIAWNLENSGARPHAYGTKYANELGIYDLTGNVWEWCWNFYDKDYFKALNAGIQTDESVTGPLRGEKRIVKGGSWDSKTVFCRISNKVATLPGNTHKFYGMRLVRSNRQ